jgi:hypothetical protein
MISFCTRDSLETTRHVSLITIKLSKKELDTSSPGLVELCLFLPNCDRNLLQSCDFIWFHAHCSCLSSVVVRLNYSSE